VIAHAVITGAAGAIGSAVARAMRAKWPAARLALVDRGSTHALAAALGNATAHVADLANIEALPGVLDEIYEVARRVALGDSSVARRAAVGEVAVGDRIAPRTAPRSVAGSHSQLDEPIDCLINCAGIMEVRSIAAWNWQDAHRLLAVDLLAPLRLQDLVVPQMIARGRGVIVNVSSMAGRVPLRGCGYYGAAKAGLAMASEIARAELASHGIRVITVYPGPVKSALEQGARDGWGGGGAMGRVAPLGDPAALADKIVSAIVRDEPRVIYPRVYGLGWTAPNLSRELALALGPAPVE
jgi:2-hydroxycyclohexanecarboxyl-CoA dehydrogenase